MCVCKPPLLPQCLGDDMNACGRTEGRQYPADISPLIGSLGLKPLPNTDNNRIINVNQPSDLAHVSNT